MRQPIHGGISRGASSRLFRGFLCTAAMLAAGIGLSPAGSVARAQTIYTWAGGTAGNFTDGAEWANASAPPQNSALNTLLFLSTTTGGTSSNPTFTNNISSGTFGLISFGTAWGQTAQATISGSAFTLQGISGVGISTSSVLSANRTINSVVTVGASQQWQHATNNSSSLSVPSVDLGSNTLTLVGKSTTAVFRLGQTAFTSSAGAKIRLDDSALQYAATGPIASGLPIDVISGSGTAGQLLFTTSGTYAGTLTGGAGIAQITVSTAGSTATLSGTFNGTTSGGIFRLSGDTTTSRNDITGLLSGTFDLQLNFPSVTNPFGTVRISNPNNSFSTSSMISRGTVILAADDPANGSNGALGSSTQNLTVGVSTGNPSQSYSVLAEGSRTIGRTLDNNTTVNGMWTRVGQLDSGTSTFSGNRAIRGIVTNLLTSGTSGSGRANFTGVLSGTSGLTMVGNGIVGLSGANTYSGATTIRSGVLSLGTSAPSGANGALGNATSTIRLGDTTSSGGDVRVATVSQVGNLASVTASNAAFGGVTLVDGDFVIVWLQNTAGQNGVYRWNTGNTLTLVASGTGAGVYGTEYRITDGAYADQRFWVNTANNAAATGFAPDGIANPNVALLLSTTGTVGRNVQVVANTSTGASTIGGSLTSGTATFSGNISLDRAVTLQAATGGTVLFQTGAWTTNNHAITVGSPGNAGVVRLANTLSSTSGVTVNNGTLQIGNNDATGSISNSTPVSVASGAILAYNRSDTVTYSGTVSGAGGLTKLGDGELQLTSANTYSGPTAVDSGSLLVNGQLGTSAVTVASGATLGGSGTIGGPVSILGGGIVAPGTSPGTLTVNDSFTLADTSILQFELDPANFTVGGGINDLITGVTALTLDGVLNVSGAGDWTAVPDNSSWRLFNYTGTLTNNGLTLGSMPTLASGQTFQIDTSTAGQVNLLVVVPEPATLALAVGGLALAGWATRRRRSP